VDVVGQPQLMLLAVDLSRVAAEALDVELTFPRAKSRSSIRTKD